MGSADYYSDVFAAVVGVVAGQVRCGHCDDCVYLWHSFHSACGLHGFVAEDCAPSLFRTQARRLEREKRREERRGEERREEKRRERGEVKMEGERNSGGEGKLSLSLSDL